MKKMDMDSTTDSDIPAIKVEVKTEVEDDFDIGYSLMQGAAQHDLLQTSTSSHSNKSKTSTNTIKIEPISTTRTARPGNMVSYKVKKESKALGTSKEKKHKCSTCGNSYIGQGGLARHFRLNPDHQSSNDEEEVKDDNKYYKATNRTKTSKCHACITCERSYVGISGLLRHYEQFPDHDTESKELKSTNTLSGPSTKKPQVQYITVTPASIAMERKASSLAKYTSASPATGLLCESSLQTEQAASGLRCDVCSDVCTNKQLNYGKNLCKSCKDFVQRLQKIEKSSKSSLYMYCITGTQNCAARIHEMSLKSCRYCRYMKCLSVGVEIASDLYLTDPHGQKRKAESDPSFDDDDDKIQGAIIKKLGSHSSYHCVICKMIFLDKDKFTEHKSSCKNNVADNSKRVISCEFCPRHFDYYPIYMKHLTTDHSKSLPYRCESCWDCFMTVRQLLDHKKEVHDNKTVKVVQSGVKVKHEVKVKKSGSVYQTVAACRPIVKEEPRCDYNGDNVLLPEFSAIIQETVENAKKMLDKSNAEVAEHPVVIKTEPHWC